MQKLKTTSLRPWLICLTASVFFFFEFFQINVISTITPYLMKEFKVGASELGIISSGYMWAVVFTLLPAGIILDFISPRKIILCSMAVAIVSTIWFANATSVHYLMYARLLIGFGGGAFCVLSAIKLATRWFNHQQLGFVIGTIIAIGMLGGVVSQGPFALILEHFSWRQGLLIDAAFGVCLWVLVFIVVRDYPENATEQDKRIPEFNMKSFCDNAVQAASRWPNWAAGMVANLLNLPVFLILSFMGVLYLCQVYGYTTLASAKINSFISWGMLIGSPFCGFISDKMQSRKQPMLLGCIVVILTTLYLIGNTNCSTYTLIGLFFLIGFAASSQILAYPMVAECNPTNQVTSGEGISATLIMSGGAIFQPIAGCLMDLAWKDQYTVDGIKLYSISDYNNGLYLLPVAAVVAMLILLSLREKSIVKAKMKFNEASVCVS